MKLLRFGFENETMPASVSVICGIMADPIGTYDAGQWKNASKGGEGKYFRQDVTNLRNFSGAYSFVQGRENLNTTCIAGFSPNENASNIDDATKNVFFNWERNQECLNQHLKINFTASQGIGMTYFYKLNKIIGLDTTGVQLPSNEQQDYIFKRTKDDFQATMRNHWHFSTTPHQAYFMTNPGLMIPNRYHGDAPFGGNYANDAQRGNLPVPSKTHMSAYPRGTAAGFFFSALDGTTANAANDQALADTMGGSAYVNTITMILNGEKQDFTLPTNLNLSGWNSIQVKYCTSPNHVFKVSVNGEDFQMFGNTNKPLNSVVDTVLIPLTSNIGASNFQGMSTINRVNRLPLVSYCVDDVALNNNIIDVDGNLEISDSDIIIPPFVICTGLELVSEVAGGQFEHDDEASSVFDAMRSNNDVRAFTNKSAVHRFNLSNVPNNLTGLEAVNVYAKNANINFPSTLRYLGFGLESGNELLMSDKSAHQLRPLSATERDSSISIMPDADAKNVVQGLTTEKFNNDCSIYIESKKQIGLNFFGNADFNGTQDKRFHALNFHIGGDRKFRQNNEAAMAKKWPYGEQSRTDGNLILETNARSDIFQNADTSNPSYAAHKYRTAVINPVSLRNGVAEIHCKNFIVKKNTHVAIPLGNTTSSRNRSDEGGRFQNFPSVINGTEYDSNQYFKGKPGESQYYNNTNISQSVIIIYAQENIYIDGDVYFEYGDSKYFAPNEHSYHSKNNRFSIVRFTGDGLIDFDMDSLRRLTNTSPSESSYQQVPADVYDYGASNMPTNKKLRAVDFSLEAGERQGVVIHGSGGTYGDALGYRDGQAVQLDGQAAIGWGCGGGGGLVTGWNGLFPGFRANIVHTSSKYFNFYGANLGWTNAQPNFGGAINSKNITYDFVASDNACFRGNHKVHDGSYIHHGVASLWRELFISGNPNLGFRYNSPARLGSEGGPWGGGRGASWTHKDPLAGIQSERFYNTSSTSFWNTARGANSSYLNILPGKLEGRTYTNKDNFGFRRNWDAPTVGQKIEDLHPPVATGRFYNNPYAFGVSRHAKDLTLNVATNAEIYKHQWKNYLMGSRAFFHLGDPITGADQYKFQETNWASNTADNVGTYSWLTRKGYANLPAQANNGSYPWDGKTSIVSRDYKGGQLSPSLLPQQLYQFEKGANTLSTAGRAGGGAPIVYLIAGGDIVIGTNGSVNARGTNPLGIQRNTYNIPAALGNQHHNIGSFTQGQGHWSSAEDTFVQSLGHDDAADSQFNASAYEHGHYGTAYTNCDGGYFGAGQRISLMGHGGGGGGCITFLHGGLFTNQGTINVDGGNPEDTAWTTPGMWWNWTGKVDVQKHFNKTDYLSFWNQAARDFDYWIFDSGVSRAANKVTYLRPRVNNANVLQPQGILNSREQFKVVQHDSTPMPFDTSTYTSAPKGGAGAWRNFKVSGPLDVRRKI